MQHCDSKCGWCARNWFKWLKAREAQMALPWKRKGEQLSTTTWNEAAATSVRPPR